MKSTVNPTDRDILRADAFRYTGRASGEAFREAFLHQPGFRFTYFLRRVAFLNQKRTLARLPAFAFHRYWLQHYRFRYGFDISPHTQIGPGFYLGHFGGVVISPEATLGANVNIAHGVTIGAESRGERKGAPILRDRVWVGAHAIVVGRIEIGSDAMIAPGAFVNFDVPPMSLVIGNPGKIVSSKGSAGYINNILEPAVTEAAVAEGLA